LFAQALSARQISATLLNERSSRSHVLITVHLDSKLPADPTIPKGGIAIAPTLPHNPGHLRCGKLHLVDLAGSETLDMSSDASRDSSRAVESRAINSSLNALGDVLRELYL